MEISPARPSVTQRPSLAPTRRNTSDELRILEHSFKVGMFADPPSKKGIVIGGDLLTKGHVQLIADLRKEAARVSYDNVRLRDKASTFEKRYRVAKMDVSHVREQLHLVQRRYEKIQTELEESQKFLRKLDALFSGEKTQRLARAMSLPSEEIEDAQLLDGLGATPHFEFRNPFENR
ncbi:MAG: hypothetical protein EOO38_00125 [Cytophagaceae bacterium]|nr:MAG: hypothetical protein EOO38_00125 [Cytophagaceae bacterium]